MDQGAITAFKMYYLRHTFYQLIRGINGEGKPMIQQFLCDYNILKCIDNIDLIDASACKVLWDGLPTVSMGDWNQLEQLLTLSEFSKSLCLMPTNTSPGSDGLTMEFYHVFQDILSPDLTTICAECLGSEMLPLLCRQAMVALLPYKGDLCNLRNWSPVLLLSMDYKVVVKVVLL
ncbi:unnamed protein product [Caretta caretta]